MHKKTPPLLPKKTPNKTPNRRINTNETVEVRVEACRDKYNITRQPIISSTSP